MTGLSTEYSQDVPQHLPLSLDIPLDTNCPVVLTKSTLELTIWFVSESYKEILLLYLGLL
jgi:hypothetical protein